MDIVGWREKIDALDRQLVELLNQRCRCAMAIGALKRGSDLPIYEPLREKQVLQQVAHFNAGPLSDRALQHIYERIIDEMRAIQKAEALANGAAPPEGRSSAMPADDRD